MSREFFRLDPRTTIAVIGVLNVVMFSAGFTGTDAAARLVFQLIPALLAASAVPVLFPPVAIGQGRYVDGGLSNNLPIEPFNDQRSEVIAVYVNPLAPLNARLNFRETIDRTVHLSFREVVARSSEGCRLYIEPPELAAFGILDLHRAERIRAIGRAHARKVLEAAFAAQRS